MGADPRWSRLCQWSVVGLLDEINREGQDSSWIVSDQFPSAIISR